jgi:hypothetical protein
VVRAPRWRLEDAWSLVGYALDAGGQDNITALIGLAGLVGGISAVCA